MKKKYLLEFHTESEHTTIKRRAASAGVSMRKYILDMSLYGKIQKKTK